MAALSTGRGPSGRTRLPSSGARSRALVAHASRDPDQFDGGGRCRGTRAPRWTWSRPAGRQLEARCRHFRSPNAQQLLALREGTGLKTSLPISI